MAKGNPMTPETFITTWANSTLKERSASQSHFNDLCEMLNVEKPTDVDKKGEWYCFERGASKTAGGEGWADVWRRGCFGWEYKGKRKDLTAAYAQLQRYAVALENPPLLVVSDMDRIIIHTNWTNTISEVHTIRLEELKDAGKRDLLRWVFTDPERPLLPLDTTPVNWQTRMRMVKAISCFLIGFVFADPTCAQVFYHYECKADTASGFKFDESLRSWQPTTFRTDKRYTIRPRTAEEIRYQLALEKGTTWGVFENSDKTSTLLCPDPSDKGGLFCGGRGDSFVFDSNSLRYQHYYAGSFVWGVDNNDDTPFIEVGRCKFVKGPDH